MTNVPTPLASAQLLAHARAAARGDELRHSATSTVERPSRHQHREQTIRGWGGAALLDLEWTSQFVYGHAAKIAYCAAYATEYVRLRAERSATPSRAGDAAVARSSGEA